MKIETMLRDEQVDVRLDAVRELSQLNCFSEELFVLALGDSDWRVRKDAVGLFLRLPDASSRATHIIEQLRHPENAGLRNAAIEVLISLGAQGTPELIRQLALSDAEVRKFIVDILGEIGHAACVGELLPFLQDEDENVRYAVVETLGKLRAGEAVASLLDLLETADAGLRFTIFDALVAIGADVPIERILPYSQDRLLRKTVFSCLGQLGDVQALSVLLEGLSDPIRRIRETAFLSLGALIKSSGDAIASADIPQLSAEHLSLAIEYLDHEKLEYRTSACYLLSLQFDQELFLRVLPLLAEEELRADVVAACKHVSIDLLEQLLAATSLDSAEAIFLIFIAGELHCAAVVPLALQAITAADPQLRYAAVITLGKVSAVEAVEALGVALGDEVPDICQAASAALRQLGQADPIAVIKAITPSFESSEASLRLLAVKTLGGLNPQEVEDYLLQAIKDVAPEVRCGALRNLRGKSSQRLLTGLSIALTDENADVRRLAASALEHFPADKSLAVLSHVLDDPDPWVRTTAIRSLQAGKVKDVLPLLERGLHDPIGVVVIAALETIAQLLPEGADKYLLESLEHSDLDVVKTTVNLALQAGQKNMLLAHNSAQVRLVTVAALQLTDLQEWQSLFEQQLSVESDPKVRQAMEDALRRGTAGV